MKAVSGNPTISHLDRSHLPDAIRVLADAFAQDPLMRYCFGVSDMDFEKSLHEMFRFACEVRLLLEWPLLGCWKNGKLVGVAGASLPGSPKWPPALQNVYGELKASIGKTSSDIMEAYARLADTNRPGAPTSSWA